jgi:predicted HAD superfamily Cof-like phosphohydrolase
VFDRPKNQSNFDDVGDFHEKFGLDSSTHRGASPREIPDDLLLFRVRFMFEELFELLDALGVDLWWDGHLIPKGAEMEITRPEDSPIDHAKAFDALIDEAYVTFGFAQLLGYPWQVGWDMVQRANMRKVRAERADQSERGGTWDVVKPEEWKAPNLHAVLYTHGWPIEGYSAPFDPPNDDEDKK